MRKADFRLQTSDFMVFFVISVIFVVHAVGAWNVNDDCVVNFFDYAEFANAWGETTDVNDLTEFAGEWLDQNSYSPVVESQSLSMTAGEPCVITITASDGDEDPLIYRVVSVSDANGTVTGAESLPFELAGNTFTFNATAGWSGVITVIYDASDGTGLAAPCGGTTQGNATITVQAPLSAADASKTAYAYDLAWIELLGTYEQDPNAISYYITALPSNGWIQDTSERAGKITAGQLPYKLTSKYVNFISDTSGMDAFGYKARAGNIWSSEAVVDVNVLPAPLDYLYFEQSGYVDVPDNDYLDITNGWGMTFWLQTRSCEGLIMSKRSGGTGWEMRLVNGQLVFYIYDSSGNVAAKVEGYTQVNNGCWGQYGIMNAGGYLSLSQFSDCVAYDYDYLEVTQSEGTFVNDVNVIIAKNLVGRVDHVKFFSGVVGGGFDINWLSSIKMIDRQDATELFAGTFGYTSAIRMPMDDGTGIVVSEVKVSNNGQIIDGENNYWVAPKELHYRKIPSAQVGYEYDSRCRPLFRGKGRFLGGTVIEKER